MMLPAGQQLTPGGVLARVEGGHNPEGVLYRSWDGRLYFLGKKADRLLWRDRKFRYMGTAAFVRGQVETARNGWPFSSGIRT